MDIYGGKLMEFEKYLKTNNLVPLDKAKYYSNWADKFLHGINYRTTAINQNSIASFISSMGKDQRYADWQIRQAENAVRLYVNNFLKMNTCPQVPVAKAPEKDSQVEIQAGIDWQEAVLKVKECMRIRHYSYSTEKTYVDWIVRFGKYIGKEKASSVSDEDVRNYMAHLAVKLHVSASTQNQAFNAILFFFRYVFHEFSEHIQILLSLPEDFGSDALVRYIADAKGLALGQGRLIPGSYRIIVLTHVSV
jgi:hypothetical protein